MAKINVRITAWEEGQVYDILEHNFGQTALFSAIKQLLDNSRVTKIVITKVEKQ